MDHFYNRAIWYFNNHNDCHNYFTVLVDDFVERWPVRVENFPHIPLETVLDLSQQEQVEKKKADLHLVSFILHMSDITNVIP